MAGKGWLRWSDRGADSEELGHQPPMGSGSSSWAEARRSGGERAFRLRACAASASWKSFLRLAWEGVPGTEGASEAVLEEPDATEPERV